MTVSPPVAYFTPVRTSSFIYLIKNVFRVILGRIRFSIIQLP